MNWSRNLCYIFISNLYKIFLFFKKKIENKTLLILIKRRFFTLVVNDSVVHSIVTASDMKLSQNSFRQLKTRNSKIFMKREVLTIKITLTIKIIHQ